ncbi:MAG: dicarboxylate/amino acid:cation symporter [Lentisphaerae bacterium]|nr:dicarboxylate/amino acid:cation symporter [Lentisphaerota bacterium]MCP4100804.1 dicarboxylate/amino acid:cation symporter [Lentisphaerota bacterium]
MYKKLKKIPLWGKVLIGLVLGVVAGYYMGKKAVMLKPIGDLFITAVKMLIVPLIFSSLMVGMTSIKDIKKMGRIGLKTFLFFVVTTLFAGTLGLIASNIFKPGVGMAMHASNAVAQQPQSLTDMFIHIIPENPVQALASGNVLQIIAIVIFLGIAVNLVGSKAQIIIDFCDALATTMYKLTDIIMNFAPIGVFALIGVVVGTSGMEAVKFLAKLVAIVYAVSFFHVVVVMSLILIFMCRLNPIRFFKGGFDAILLAFSTSSSAVALPVSMRCSEESLGVHENIYSFTLPLGATVNMNGTAIYQGVSAVFIAQAYGIQLSMSQYITIVTISSLAAIGTAGIPGAGVIMLSMVLQSAGLPLDGVALVMGVDRILDMARTAVNVAGGLLATVYVGKSEKEFNPEIYNTAAQI